MSISVIKEVLKTDLPGTQRMVLIALASFLREKDRSVGCWPSIPTLVARAGFSDRTIQISLQKLEAAKHITRKERRVTSTLYQVHPVVVPRSNFGGRQRDIEGSNAQFPYEGPSPPPRSFLGKTPEAASPKQGESKIKKGECRPTPVDKRSRKADSVAGHLTRSDVPILRRLFDDRHQ
ncbi:MAG: helix-turn-helix domain-containing protein [Alteripontixanthobacter sp.]